jgi:mono/diheme cytochrome c family protein
LPVGEPAAVDVPPWWRVAQKRHLYYTGEGVGDHARLLMSAAMYCADDPATAAEFDARFVDVVAYIKSIQAPKFPDAIDGAKATAGKTIYASHCESCHGSPGAYPNKAIAVDEVGTDPTLAAQEASPTSVAFNTWYEHSWYGTAAPKSRIVPTQTYVAPPLDGVWATAPYLHNGSVPDLDTLLDSTRRPEFWTRDFEASALDRVKVGVRYTALDYGQDSASESERTQIYDTTLPGYSAQGHTYGDALSATDRAALIEYLKTL